MATKKVIKEVIETPVVEETIKTSEEYNKFLSIIENYKKQNPVKFELKKEALLAKLETLK